MVRTGIVVFLAAALSAGIAAAQRVPLTLDPGNPHYFLFRGKPTVLITSGEHYGAVINLDFDYVKYLKTLEADGLNLTRTFVGSYLENQGAFQIASNTLAPAPGRFLCPWARSDQPGAADGLNKWDLTKWNDGYFKRLTDFVAEAGKRGIVVEVNLFTPMYEQILWDINPMNAKNNVNGIGAVARTEVLALKDDRLTAVQDAMVRRIVTALRDFDNVYYEICNEPYFAGVTPEWQKHISATISDTEKDFPHPHLISQNIANGSRDVEDANPLVSIFNFHYCRPPDAVKMNFDLNRVIGNNETGFDGTADSIYRVQAWDFILAGGGLFNNLDYSFTAGHEDGTFAVPPTQPGGGSAALRKQYGILRTFMGEFRLDDLRPSPDLLKQFPEGASVRVLAEPGAAYAVYIHHGGFVPVDEKKYEVAGGSRQSRVVLELPAGRLSAAWVNTKTGAVDRKENFRHGGGERELVSPPYTEDIALRIEVRVRAETGMRHQRDAIPSAAQGARARFGRGVPGR